MSSSTDADECGAQEFSSEAEKYSNSESSAY